MTDWLGDVMFHEPTDCLTDVIFMIWLKDGDDHQSRVDGVRLIEN